MNRLMLMRHAKSDWSVGEDDFNRPLNDRGRRDARRIGRYLGESGQVPQLIVSSPARRAIDTAEACLSAAGVTTGGIVRDERIYHASAAALRDVLADYQVRAGSVMLVGHNPGLELLLEKLVDTDLPVTDSGKLFTTANLAVIDRDTGALLHLVRPKDLRD